MKFQHFFIALPLLLVFSNINAQKMNPAHFTFSFHPISDKHAEVHITATLDQDWHLYSQTQPKEAIGVPTKIVFSKNPLIIIPSTVPKEIGKKETYQDKTAGIVQYQYGNMVEFVQSVALKSKAKTNINGTITYQVCTNEMCLPPKTIPFSIPVP